MWYQGAVSSRPDFKYHVGVWLEMEDTEKKKRKMTRTWNPNDYRMEAKNSPKDWPGRWTAGQEETGYNPVTSVSSGDGSEVLQSLAPWI